MPIYTVKATLELPAIIPKAEEKCFKFTTSYELAEIRISSFMIRN